MGRWDWGVVVDNAQEVVNQLEEAREAAARGDGDGVLEALDVAESLLGRVQVGVCGLRIATKG